MDYDTFSGQGKCSDHAGTDVKSEFSDCGSFNARSAARLQAVTHRFLMLKARQPPQPTLHIFHAANLALCAKFFLFFNSSSYTAKKELVIRNSFKQSLQKKARCSQPAPKTIPRTAEAGAIEFLVVKRQGARCLAQNNYKLHALLHFINLS